MNTPDTRRQLLASYGTLPEHWPEEQRQNLAAALDENPDQAHEEQALDQTLARLPLEEVPHHLRHAVLNLAHGPVVHWWWPFGPLWQPAVALAFSALLGIGLGSWWAPPTPQEPSWQEAMQLIEGLAGENDHDP